METVMISMSKADLSRLIVDAVSATLQVQAPNIAPMGVEDAAKFLNLSVSTLYKKTSEGILPHMKVSKKLYFDRDELTNWLAEHRKKTTFEIEVEATNRLV